MALRVLIAFKILLLVGVHCSPTYWGQIEDTGVETAAAVQPITKDGCGTTKGCILHPEGCDPSRTCNITLTYARKGDSVRFEIGALRPEGSQDFYAAVGFSLDGMMANTSVIACIYTASNSAATASLWYNPPPTQEGNPNNHVPSRRVAFGPADPPLVRLEEAGVVNDILVCRYNRKIAVPTNKRAQVWPLNASYHLLRARGDYNAKDQVLRYHFERVPSPLLTDVTTAGGP
jgi:hypothetical protein